jgi:hypothetical protein
VASSPTVDCRAIDDGNRMNDSNKGHEEIELNPTIAVRIWIISTRIRMRLLNLTQKRSMIALPKNSVSVQNKAHRYLSSIHPLGDSR